MLPDSFPCFAVHRIHIAFYIGKIDDSLVIRRRTPNPIFGRNCPPFFPAVDIQRMELVVKAGHIQQIIIHDGRAGQRTVQRLTPSFYTRAGINGVYRTVQGIDVQDAIPISWLAPDTVFGFKRLSPYRFTTSPINCPDEVVAGTNKHLIADL